MFRVDADGALVSLPDPDPAGDTAGYFSKGNPSGGERATVIPADWLNAIQETLLHPLEKRGLSPKKTSPYDLLTQAIRSFLAEAGLVNGLRLTFSGGVLTIKGEDGNDLSATNFGYVPCVDADGKKVALKVTANGVLKDDSNAFSDLTNLGFGISEGADWGQDAPFFLYAINKGDADIDGTNGKSAFALARTPCMGTTPSAANDIGNTATIPVNDSQNVILLLGDSYTVANYVSLPARLIGCVRMRWSSTTHDWTIQTLGRKDGLGLAALDETFATTWNLPQGQMGAVPGSHMKANGGTAPLFSSDVYYYNIDRSGMVDCSIGFSGDGGTDGAGSVTAIVAIPYVALNTSIASPRGVMQINAIGGGKQLVVADFSSDGVAFDLLKTTDMTALANSDFSNGARTVEGAIRYKAY